jgi:hypothetical protein
MDGALWDPVLILWKLNGGRNGAKQCQMSKPKVQMKSEAQMTRFNKKDKVLTLSHLGVSLTFGF